MSMEVSCGQCQGQFTTNGPGSTDACPHCGARLSTPENGPSFVPDSPASEVGEERTSFLSDPPTVIARGIFQDHDPVEITLRPSMNNETLDFSWMSAKTPPTPADSLPRFIDSASLPIDEAETTANISESVTSNDSSTSNFHFDSVVDPEEIGPAGMTISAEMNPSSMPPTIKKETISTAPSPVEEAPGASEQTTITASPVFPRPSVSGRASTAKNELPSSQAWLSMLLILVGTYASLLTLYLLYLTLFGQSHQLESLPDLKTVKRRGGKAVIPGPKNALPPGHVLKLGQTQRYGDIRVTPIRITKGPLAFSHFSGDITRERDPSEPVLKLWLKFENVSNRKTITPLDSTLMFYNLGQEGKILSFNVIFPDSDRPKDQMPYFYHFDRIATDSEWSIVGQSANRALAPQEIFETFIPSEENIEGLTGNLVWRVHFRKGYGPKTGNGVTTLIDVHFNSDDIKPDPV